MTVKGERAVGRRINQELGISVHRGAALCCAPWCLSCDPVDCSGQAPLSMGILQVRILAWAAMPSLNAHYNVQNR